MGCDPPALRSAPPSMTSHWAPCPTARAARTRAHIPTHTPPHLEARAPMCPVRSSEDGPRDMCACCVVQARRALSGRARQGRPPLQLPVLRGLQGQRLAANQHAVAPGGEHARTHARMPVPVPAPACGSGCSTETAALHAHVPGATRQATHAVYSTLYGLRASLQKAGDTHAARLLHAGLGFRGGA